MKIKLLPLIILLGLVSVVHQAAAQGTAFTYSGQLQYLGSPAPNGLYDFQFKLSNAPSGGSQVGNTLPKTAVPVTNGLFTTTLDFGAVFTGNATWLAINVCSNGVGNFQSLAPLQELAPTPYAIFAESASGLSGTLPANQLISIGNNNGGSENFFVGQSGNLTTSGSGNTANGFDAFYSSVNGSYNTANGFKALYFNTSGSYNTADGLDALYYNTIGSFNTAAGQEALTFNTSGSNNIALGNAAGFYITTGSSNIDIGNEGFSTDTNIIRLGSGQTQTFIAGTINGDGGGLTGLNASQLKSIGNGSGDLGNFFVGPAGNATTSGDANTAIGGSAFSANTSGYENTAIGVDALFANTTGSDNTAIGRSALDDNTTGIDNTAIGVIALAFNTTGSNNIALGYQAGYNISTGSSNIDIGNPGLFTDANTIRIGSGQGQIYIAGVYGATPNEGSATAVYVDANGQFGTVGPGSGGGSGTLPSYVVTNGETAPVTLSNNLFVAALSLPSTAVTPDIIYSGSALLVYGDNSGNFFSGQNAGNVTTTGSANTADGVFALTQNTLGANNAAYGFEALFFNSSGSNNLALGYQAGYNITTGGSNIDIGNPGLSTDANIIRIGSGQSQTYIAGTINGDGGGLINLNASQLTSIGNADSPFGGNFFVGSAGNLTVSGYDNLGLGRFALYNLTSGYDNTAIGIESLQGNSTGNGNTAFGYFSLPNISGNYNTSVGDEALYSNTSGSQNTAVGYYSLKLNTTGGNNVASGYQALSSSTTGSNNVADGYEALYFTRTGSGNIALGYEAGYSLGLTSSSNIDIGNPGANNENNTIRIGTSQSQTYLAGVINGNGGGLINLNAAQLTGTLAPGQLPNSVVTNKESGVTLNGTFSGDGSGLVNINISASVVNGNFTGTFSGDGSKLTGLDASQLTSVGDNNGGNFNFFLGKSGNSTTGGSRNTANGFEALFFNSSGNDNTANGFSALYNNTQGNANTADGSEALLKNSSGNFNTAIGYQALYYGGTNNVGVGYQAGYNFTGNESSNIDIGNMGVAGESGIIRIGDFQTATYLAGTVYANGVALTSDRNAKENFTALDAKEVLAKVISLPVSEWNYKNNSADTRHIGPMAQDFHAAFQLDGADDKHIAVVDEGGVALAAIQGLNQKLEGEVKERDVKIQNLEKKLDELQSVVKQLATRK